MRFRATGNFKSAVLLGVTILGAVFAFAAEFNDQMTGLPKRCILPF